MRVLRETYAGEGIPWTLNYDAQGRVIEREWIDGNLSCVITYDSFGFGTASGNMYNEAGEILATSAQMTTVKAALIALALTTQRPKFKVSDVNNISIEWNAPREGFRGYGGECILNAQLQGAVIANPGTANNLIFTATIPGWMRSVGSTYISTWWAETPGTTAGWTKLQRTLFNGGTALYSTGSGSNTTTWYQVTAPVKEFVLGTVKSGTSGTAVGDRSNQTVAGSGGATDKAIAAGTDITVTSEIAYALDPGTVNCTGWGYELIHRLG
jgi:YD repeat-containing protein